MSRDKQIEEMARDMCICRHNDICEMDGNPCDLACGYLIEARDLYEKGYRKASEVAREIFEEIGTLLYLNALQGDVFTGRYFSEELESDIAELKKKYTEDE